ncbi:chloride channel protein [Desulforegula conservatrix]|uniref:chloride channel protein n=1 Tax=Desulforegula conservatrix TaxID=153026 RepID=UPI0003F9DB4D|nr:chloride channel protein [Desulforegula conservatrix]
MNKIFKSFLRFFLFPRYDDRLILIIAGAFTGICSGIAAVFLAKSIHFITELLYGGTFGWYSVLFPACGAFLSALVLYKVFKDEGAHGVPDVIYSVSKFGGALKLRSSLSRLISSALTIGSGGSAGPEAPVVMSGASIGSNIAKLFKLNSRQRIILVGCGTAGAISAIFNAPISGMIFTLEIIIGEWHSRNIIPIAVAAVTGAQTGWFLKGKKSVFIIENAFNFELHDIVSCIGLAIFTGLASILLTRLMRGMSRLTSRIKLPVWCKAPIGGLMVGVIGLLYPYILGEGYEGIQMMIEGNFDRPDYIIWFLFLPAFYILLKSIATSLTIEWGGSGGIFAPSLVIGAFTGVFYYRVLSFLLPGYIWAGEGWYALIGMTGLIAGIMQAPLTGIFLVVEITGGYGIIVPLILVSAISSHFCRFFEPASIYLRSLVENGKLLRPGTDERVLSDLTVMELIEKDCQVIGQHMILRELVLMLKETRRNYFSVKDEVSGKFVGMVHLNDIRPYLMDDLIYDNVFVYQIMHTDVQTIGLDEDLTKVLELMDYHGLFSIPVVVDGYFEGMISKATLLDRYRKELRVQTAF